MEKTVRYWVDRAAAATSRRNLSEHLSVGPLTAYLRWTRRLNPFSGEYVLTMEIGSVEVEEDRRGQGVFTEFISLWEKIAEERGRQVMVECVHNPALQEMLRKRGYIQLEDSWWRPIIVIH